MKKITKNLIIAFFIVILCIIYAYICAIDAIPTSTILFQGEDLNVKTLFGITLNDEIIQTSIPIDEKTKTKKIDVKLFDKFTVKEVGVSIIERTTVVPVGEITGLKLYTNGVLVVGMSEIKGMDNKKYKPYEDTKIQEGDIIIDVNDILITDTDK